MTSEHSNSTVPLWPFLIVDAVFIGLAAMMLQFAHRPLLWWEAAFLIVCAVAGGWSFLTPFLRRSEHQQAQSQAQLLSGAVNQIQKLDTLASQIGSATAQWQGVQEQSSKTVGAAKEVAVGMAAEAKAFSEFLQKANDGEKAHLRLEVEKLRRAEGEWLQVLTRMLDHVFALVRAALHSGQPQVIEQLQLFQNSCRDIARRIGLVPTTAQAGEAFDPNLHQLADESPVPENSVILDMMATGYTYQGRLLRRALVTVQAPVTPEK